MEAAGAAAANSGEPPTEEAGPGIGAVEGSAAQNDAKTAEKKELKKAFAISWLKSMALDLHL